MEIPSQKSEVCSIDRRKMLQSDQDFIGNQEHKVFTALS